MPAADVQGRMRLRSKAGDKAAEITYRLLSLPLHLVEKVADVMRTLLP